MVSGVVSKPLPPAGITCSPPMTRDAQDRAVRGWSERGDGAVHQDRLPGRRAGIGGIAGGAAGTVGNPYTGMIDEVRLSTAVVSPDLSQAPAKTTGTTKSAALDEGQGAPVDIAGSTRFTPPTASTTRAASTPPTTSWSVLRRALVCPGELASSAAHPTLSVQEETCVTSLPSPTATPTPGNGYDSRPRSGAIPVPPSAGVLEQDEGRRHALWRQPSFYGYYDRFYEKNPQSPTSSKRPTPSGSLRATTSKPNQMCFTNPGFVQQVVKDANDYFDGKGLKPGGAGRGDYFAYVPMDTNGWCKCPSARPLFDQTGEG